MEKSKKEIGEILFRQPTSAPPGSFPMLAVIKPTKDRRTISLYLENAGMWVAMPVDDIVGAEEIDTVKVEGELCKVVLMEIKMSLKNNHYQAILMNSLMSLSMFAVSDDCGCGGHDTKKIDSPRVYKRGGRPRKVTTGAGKNCTHCAFINGSWWCIDWCM